jgi:hypothetical protein
VTKELTIDVTAADWEAAPASVQRLVAQLRLSVRPLRAALAELRRANAALRKEHEALRAHNGHRPQRRLIAAYMIVRRCGETAHDRGLARFFATSGRRARSHSTFSLGLFHANASPDILQQALEIPTTLAFSRAA